MANYVCKPSLQPDMPQQKKPDPGSLLAVYFPPLTTAAQLAKASVPASARRQPPFSEDAVGEGGPTFPEPCGMAAGDAIRPAGGSVPAAGAGALHTGSPSSARAVAGAGAGSAAGAEAAGAAGSGVPERHLACTISYYNKPLQEHCCMHLCNCQSLSQIQP